MFDYLFIHCDLNIQKIPPKHQVVSYRKLKAIDMINFSNVIETCFEEEGWDEWDCIQDAVDHYSSILGSILNKHAPIKTNVVRLSHWQPWLDDDLRLDIHLCRKKKRGPGMEIIVSTTALLLATRDVTQPILLELINAGTTETN